MPARKPERRRALAVVLVSLAVFAVIAPFATVKLAPIIAFVPSYQSALAINDLITAVLLLGQLSVLKHRAIVVLASGYLFTALMAVAHALSFPGLLSPTGLFGGSQTTAWLYMFWHSGFPLTVIAYALLSRREDEAQAPAGSARSAIAASAIWALIAVGGMTLLGAYANESLPDIMTGNAYTPATPIVVTTVWSLSLLALAVLWLGTRHTVLDLWLMVVMCAWLFDVALSTRS